MRVISWFSLNEIRKEEKEEVEEKRKKKKKITFQIRNRPHKQDIHNDKCSN